MKCTRFYGRHVCYDVPDDYEWLNKNLFVIYHSQVNNAWINFYSSFNGKEIMNKFLFIRQIKIYLLFIIRSFANNEKFIPSMNDEYKFILHLVIFECVVGSAVYRVRRMELTLTSLFYTFFYYKIKI